MNSLTSCFFIEEDINFMFFKSKYTLVYFHNGVSFLDTKQIKFLKTLFEKLPLKYFSNLLNIFVISPSLAFKSKLILGFSFVSSFLKLKIIYLDE